MTVPRDCAPLLEARDLDEMAEWAAKRPVRHGWKGRTCRELWDASPRGDWLLDWAEAAGVDRPTLVRATVACVRPALRFVPEGDDRPRLAVEAAERWADEPTEENRRKAREAREGTAGASRDAGAAAWKAAGRGTWKREAGAARAAENVGWAAGWVEEGRWNAGAASRHAADAHFHAEGPESEAAAHRACADEVRHLVPFLELSMVAAPR